MMLGRYLAINTEQPMPFRLPMKGQVYIKKTVSIQIYIKRKKKLEDENSFNFQLTKHAKNHLFFYCFLTE